MVNVIERLQTVKCHCEWLLGDSRIDETLFNSGESIVIGIHGNDNTIPGMLLPPQCFSDIPSCGTFQAHERIDSPRALIGQVMHRAIKSVAGISFDIEHFDDLNTGIILKNILVASEPVI